MTLKNELYTIDHIDTTDGSRCYHVRLNPDHYIYRAHFPGQPITPGVCIIQMAKELLEDALEQPLRIVTVKNVKFLAVISPEETPAIAYRLNKVATREADGATAAQMTVADGERMLAKVSIVLAADNPAVGSSPTAP